MPNPYHTVDVFSQEPFNGNPLAVIFDADHLSTNEMQHITRWMNLSETAFILKPTNPSADYKVRIFTLTGELPFAGHPTLGSCHAWMSNGGIQKNEKYIIQECGVGLIKIKRNAKRLSFAAPPLIRSGQLNGAELDLACRILGITRKDILASNWIDNGPGWMGILLDSAETVLNLKPKSLNDDKFDIGVIGAYPNGSECQFELRALFNNHNGILIEDPVTGSLNASTAQWLMQQGIANNEYIASQGTCLNRKGRIFLKKDDFNTIWVGGHCHSLVKGVINLDFLLTFMK